MTRQLLLLSCLLFAYSCHLESKRNTENLVLNEGQGISKYKIGQLTRDSINRFFGNEYNLVKYESYSVAMKYDKLGLSFYYLQEDSNERIIAIACDTNFIGLTSKGFNIKKMKIKDVIRIYGVPWWRYIGNTPEAHYDSLGIYFSTISKEDPPEYLNSYSLDDTFALHRLNKYYDSLYMNEKVSEISIGIPGSSF
jgi:hypothetical protein